MQTSKQPEWLGILTSCAGPAHGSDGPAPQRTRRNTWIVVAFFGLVVASWINGLF